MTKTRSDSGDSPADPGLESQSVRAFWPLCHLPTGRLDDFLTLIDRYRRLIIEGNRITSLVAEDSLRGFHTKHVCDSLAILQAFPGLLELPQRVADLGSGAGLPGIVLALALPQIDVTAIEPNHKKAEFLLRAVEELGVESRCQVVARPGRELGHDPAYEGRFDIVVARAVGLAGQLIHESRRLIRPAGCLVFYKTPAAVQEELPLAQREAKKHKLEIQVSSVIELPEGAGERQFLLVRKA
jgi:16S rRNA (guanine527-N7)-methyltransferase